MSAFLRFVGRARLLLMLVAGLLVLGLLAGMSLGLIQWSDNRRFARGIALTLLVFIPALAMALGSRKAQRRWPWR
ncbi:MAG TPA: hypothetical protein VKY54_04405 [Kiloniellales bacterium]|nr:hypothetical protein [Kiloniellales bacterium]